MGLAGIKQRKLCCKGFFIAGLAERFLILILKSLKMSFCIVTSENIHNLFNGREFRTGKMSRRPRPKAEGQDGFEIETKHFSSTDRPKR